MENKELLTVGKLKELLNNNELKDTDQIVVHLTDKQATGEECFGDHLVCESKYITRVDKSKGLWTVDTAIIWTVLKGEV